MSVVAAVGPAAASYGQPLCGGGARKRKDAGVVQDQDHDHDQDQEAGSSLRGGKNAALFVLETVEEEADADTERSSIGAASEDGDDDDEEVGSGGTKGAGAALACMDMGALDDALPIKRGLSNFFSGKSRSFVANLRDAASAGSSARGLAKPENPFNKRRRVLRYCATRWRPARPPRSPPPPPPT